MLKQSALKDTTILCLFQEGGEKLKTNEAPLGGSKRLQPFFVVVDRLTVHFYELFLESKCHLVQWNLHPV